jgi:mono/diheme cytochrome c family protein
MLPRDSAGPAGPRGRRPLPRALALLALVAVSGPTAAAQDGAEDFLTLCARCHGAEGDGQGPEVLDRPARSFKDGGFSFGNTAEAIGRTITHGIPGSPMPAFGETLLVARVEALARHVLSLAPPQTEVPDADTILAVGEHPVVVRGGLPPIADGADDHPRGLLLGLPEGLTFEYRADDLRLLGVRAGEFVRRTDWTGRGGTPLEPLGRVVWLAEGGDPGPFVFVRPRGVGEERPLAVRLRSTRTPAEEPSLHWTVENGSGDGIASVNEQPRVVTTSLGAGFARRLVVRTTGEHDVVFRWAPPAGESLGLVDRHGLVFARPDGTYEAQLVHIADPQGATVRLHISPTGTEVTVKPGAKGITITAITVLMSDWPDDGFERLVSELGG